MRVLGCAMFAALRAIRDELLNVRATHLLQPPDSDARDLTRGQLAVGVGTTEPEEVRQFLGTHQVFGLFSLWIWGHQDTSGAVSLPLHLVSGSCPRAARVVPVGALPALRLVSGSASPSDAGT